MMVLYRWIKQNTQSERKRDDNLHDDHVMKNDDHNRHDEEQIEINKKRAE